MPFQSVVRKTTRRVQELSRDIAEGFEVFTDEQAREEAFRGIEETEPVRRFKSVARKAATVFGREVIPKIDVAVAPAERRIERFFRPTEEVRFRDVAREALRPGGTLERGFELGLDIVGSIDNIFRQEQKKSLLQTGLLQTASALEITASRIADNLRKADLGPFDIVDENLRSLAQALEERSAKDLELSRTLAETINRVSFKDPETRQEAIAQSVIQNSPNLLGGIMVGLASAPTGPFGQGAAVFAYSAALEGGFARQEAEQLAQELDKDLSDEQLDKLMIKVGLANGILEAILPITVTRQLTQPLKTTLLRTVARNIIQNGIEESGTEFLQETVTNLVLREIDPERGVFEGGLEAAAVGLVTGVGAGGGVVVREVARKVGLKTEDVNKRIQELEQKEKLTKAEEREFSNLKRVRSFQKFDEINSIKNLVDPEGQVSGEVFTEMDVARKGERIFIERPDTMDLEVRGIPSTFPKWVSPELRSRKLFDQVQENILNNTIPETPRAIRLFTEYLNEVNGRLEIEQEVEVEDVQNILNSIKESANLRDAEKQELLKLAEEITRPATITQTKRAIARETGLAPEVRVSPEFKQRIRDVARGAREAGVATRKTISDRLGEINQIIRESNLTQKDKAKFVFTPKQIAEIKSEEAFQKKINDILDRISRLEAKEKFRDARRRADKAIKSTKVKNRVSKFPAALQDTMQNLFDTLREDSKLTIEEAQEKLSEINKELEGKIPTFEQSLRNTYLSIKAGSDLITEQDATQLADDLEALIEEGRTLKDLETFNKWQKLQEDIEAVEGALTFKEGRETFGPEELALKERVKNRLKILGVKTLTDWPGLMENVDWDRPITDKVLRDLLGNVTPNNVDYAGRYGEYSRNVNKAVRDAYPERFNEKFNKLPDKVRNTVEFSAWTEGFVSRLVIIDLINEKVNLGKLTNRDGKTRELKMTRGELIKRWIELQDPTLRESFIHGNRYGDGQRGDDFFQAIDEAMDESDKKFAREAMRMWQELYDQINPVYKAVYGVNLLRNPFYSPIRRRGFEVDIEKQFGEFLGEQNFRSAVTSGSFKERVNSILPIESQDVFKSLDRHFGEMTYFIAWAEQVRRFHQIFNTQSVRDGMIDTFGESAGNMLLKRIDFQIKQFANKGYRTSTGLDSLVGKLRRGFIMGKIFFKPAISLKQTVSRINFLEVMSVKELVEGEFEFWKNPIKNSRILREESVFMRERGKHYERDINDTLKSDEYARYTKTKSFLELGSLYVRIGDADATIFPATWAYRKKLLAEGKTIEQARDLYEDFADNTQQSANISTQSEFQQSGELARQFTVFRTQQHQNARKVVNAVKSVFQEGGTSKKNLKKVARTIVIYHSIQNMLFQLVATGLIQLIGDEDEEFLKDMTRAGVLGSLNFFPVAYDLIDSILRAAMGSQVFNFGTQELPIQSISQDIYNLTREIDPAEIEDIDVMEFIDDMSRLGGDFGIPSEQLLNLGRGAYSMAEGNFLRGSLEAAQWSQWALSPLDEEKPRGFEVPTIEVPTIEVPAIEIPELSI